MLALASTSPYLFSGILMRGECGANLILVTGGGTHRHPKYACSRRFNRCGRGNGLCIRREDLEDLLLGKLQSEILRPQAVDHAIVEFQRQLGVGLVSLSGGLAEVTAGIGSTPPAAAIAESGRSKALLAEIARKEAELQAITDRLLSASPESIEARIGEIRTFVAIRLGNLRELLRKDSALARAELLKHTSEITMTPNENIEHRFYVAEGNWNFLGSDPVVARERQPSGWRIRMVAGVGFEPTTFGL
jgi:hypothetical protein